MKKVIGFLLLAISMFSFFIFYKEHKETQIFNMKNAEHHLKNSYEIIIPTKINMLPRGKQHDKILRASKGTEVSIYFTRIDQDSKKEKIIKYIYTVDDEYMKNFHISDIQLVSGYFIR
ncbi:hypothetical protein [Haloimpatiens lingqiaonensis]|uniref:hypothetical protein n=1 Tax=Haloimpatiens lingqiaonensis TaxID=1380675 RepID=UPI0010FF1978|nr:hypothetical protein [Haloimpatiens lingqiaonensis]